MTRYAPRALCKGKDEKDADPMLRSALLNVMIAAARKAGRALKRDFGEVENLQVSLKGPANFVTAADRRAEETLFEELTKARPGYGFLGEEGGARAGSDKTNRWIVDPLDGTTNFLHGIPQFAISIALEREGVVDRRRGLQSGQRRDCSPPSAARAPSSTISASASPGAPRLADAVVACGLPHLGRGDLELARRETGAVQEQVAGLRRFGAAALDLAWVAAGRLDAYLGARPQALGHGGRLILVREAGGFVVDCDGGDAMFAKGDILAANDAIKTEMLRVLEGGGQTLDRPLREDAWPRGTLEALRRLTAI